MKVIRSYLEKGKHFALVEIPKGQTQGELKDKLKSIDIIVKFVINQTQCGLKTVRTKELQKMVYPLDHDYMKRLREKPI